MSKYLTFTTSFEAQYSVYLPRVKFEPVAFHQEAEGRVWAEWPNSSSQQNAYVRNCSAAFEVARIQIALRGEVAA